MVAILVCALNLTKRVGTLVLEAVLIAFLETADFLVKTHGYIGEQPSHILVGAERDIRVGKASYLQSPVRPLLDYFPAIF
jgi:hypothetical protein